MSLDRPGPARLPRKTSAQSLAAGGEPRLSVIAEDGDVPPQHAKSILKPHHRPFSRIWNLGYPPRPSYEKSPPDYTEIRDVPPTRMEKLTMNVRSNKFVARRGGWKRLLCIIVLIIALVIGLAVGLTIGLKNRSTTSTTTQPSTTSQNASMTGTGPFPVGTYALATFLDTISTECTSNPVTWRCYPYTTYSESPSGALSTFVWIITGTVNNYLISSTSNPFAITFSDVPLSLVDANMSTERYTFSVPILKIVVPSAAITTDNSMAACNYNNTSFQASLYTRMPNTYMANATAPPAASASAGTGTASGTLIQPWPYAVEVDQSIDGGINVPYCYEVMNGNPGAQVTNGLEPQPTGSSCNCTYKNFDP